MARDHRQHFVLDDSENKWGGFLYDEDIQSSVVREYFKPGRDAPRRTPDRLIVTEAVESCCTIITKNAKDYLQFFREQQQTDNDRDCRDCWGLILLPDDDVMRQYALLRSAIKHGLRVNGKELPWKAAAYANLCVSVQKEGRLSVRRFKRCRYCERATSLLEQSWYAALDVVPTGTTKLAQGDGLTALLGT